MVRCNCAGTCTCTFKEGRGVSLSGAGSKRNPLVVDMTDEGASRVIGSVSDSVQVLVTGAGSDANPYVVTMNRLSTAGNVIVMEFNVPGSYVWSKPSFGSLALVTVIGGGGGGAGAGGLGSGITTDSGASLVQNGTGGSPGDQRLVDFQMSDLPATVDVTVGYGGNGGPPSEMAGPGDVGIGYPGVFGQPSTFGNIQADGGYPGQLILQGMGDPRTAASNGKGGTGGLAKASPFVGVDGLDGAASYGEFPFVGWGAVATIAVAGWPGGLSQGLRKGRGTGGGGGLGTLLGAYSGGGRGGDGGPGAGGGGGGVGVTYGGAGGKGGDGVVRIVIQ